MSMTKRSFISMLMMGVSSWLCAAPAMAVTGANFAFTFSQDGYSEGATVTGAFSGVDLDGNGILVHFPANGGGPPIQHLELTSWSMHFSGNILSPAFDLTLSDLFGFVYQLGANGLGDDPAFDPTLNQNLIEGIGAIGADHFYTSGLGPNNFVGGYVGGHIDFNGFNNLDDQALYSSANLVLVTPVPEPAGVSLLMAAGLLFALVERSGRLR
jgi:hypothetical protein